MNSKSGENLGGLRSENLAKVGYWIFMIYFSVVGFSLAIGAPSAIADNMAVSIGLFIIFFFWRYIGLGRRGKDERLAKIATRSMTISWTLTLIIISALITLNSNYFTEITGNQILGIIIVEMVISFSASNEFYKRKGDVFW